MMSIDHTNIGTALYTAAVDTPLPVVVCASQNSSLISKLAHVVLTPAHHTRSVNQSVSQSIGQSISQLVNRSVSWSIGQSINQSVTQLVNQSVNRSVSQSVD